jgi:hypothetical protein
MRRMYIVLLLDEIVCSHQLCPFVLCCHLVLGFLCWFFCLDDLSIGNRGVLKSPTTTVLESICAFKSFSICLMKLGAYRLIIVISFWCIVPFISMKCPSLSHLTNVSLKSTLSHISIATPACFQGPLDWLIFFQPFTLRQCLFLSKRWVSCKQHIVRSFFLIQFATLCLLNVHWHSVLILIGMWWFLPFSCFCCLMIWLCAAKSMLLSYYLSFLLLWFDTSFPLVVVFAFIFCMQNSL